MSRRIKDYISNGNDIMSESTRKERKRKNFPEYDTENTKNKTKHESLSESKTLKTIEKQKNAELLETIPDKQEYDNVKVVFLMAIELLYYFLFII